MRKESSKMKKVTALLALLLALTMTVPASAVWIARKRNTARHSEIILKCRPELGMDFP